MAIVKASFTKNRAVAKAAIRYITHRPGKDGTKITRTLFGSDGVLSKRQAYRMIDEAEKGTLFFRIVISPDPSLEDTKKDLFLWEITEQTMLHLEERVHNPISFVAVEHDDHAPHRHVHVLALVQGRVSKQDLQALRQTATDTAVQQRQARDILLAQQAQQREGVGWEQ